MRILHVVTAFPRAPGDIIAPWLIELLRRQRAAGHEVDVFAPLTEAAATPNSRGFRFIGSGTSRAVGKI